MIKSALHIVLLTLLLFGLHQWALMPVLHISNKVPVLFQHLLLGGSSLIIFIITDFISKNFFSIVGFVVLGFLTLKMIFVGIFVHFYKTLIDEEPVIKYVLLGFYFVYLSILLIKIVPLINLDSLKSKGN